MCVCVYVCVYVCVCLYHNFFCTQMISIGEDRTHVSILCVILGVLAQCQIGVGMVVDLG